MSPAETSFPSSVFVGEAPRLSDLTFASVRVALARALAVFSFLWPFFNYRPVDPGNSTEIDFLPVFLAALLVPEIALRDKWSRLLALPVFAVAVARANPSAPLRLAIDIVPPHGALNLTRYLRDGGRQLESLRGVQS